METRFLNRIEITLYIGCRRRCGLLIDGEFEAYIRLLRQQGEGLANLPRRWGYVWTRRRKPSSLPIG